MTNPALDSSGGALQQQQQQGSSDVPYFHELEKGSRISRVILFACRKPKDVFRLSMVGYFWRECFVDFKYGKDIFRGKVFDARLEWQSAADVETIWKQAAAILLAQDKYVESKTYRRELRLTKKLLRRADKMHRREEDDDFYRSEEEYDEIARETTRKDLFEPELFAEMVAAMRIDNQRGLAEQDAVLANPRTFAPGAAIPDGCCIPDPLVAKHRFRQQLGACCVALRSVNGKLRWFEDLERANRVPFDLGRWEDECDDKRRYDENGEPTLLRISQEQHITLQVLEDIFHAERSADGLLTELSFERFNCGDVRVDLSFLPPTLTWLSLDETKISNGVIDFAALAGACPRAELLSFTGCGLQMHIDLDNVLSAFPQLTECYLGQNDLKSKSGIDPSKFPQLGLLSVSSNPRLGGIIHGLDPTRFHLSAAGAKLRTPSAAIVFSDNDSSSESSSSGSDDSSSSGSTPTSSSSSGGEDSSKNNSSSS